MQPTRPTPMAALSYGRFNSPIMQPTRGSHMRIMVCVNHRFWQRGVELCALVGAWETVTRADQAMMFLTIVPCTSVKKVLEALASGKSSRILIGATSVHGVANRAQRRDRMPMCRSAFSVSFRAFRGRFFVRSTSVNEGIIPEMHRLIRSCRHSRS